MSYNKISRKALYASTRLSVDKCTTNSCKFMDYDDSNIILHNAIVDVIIEIIPQVHEYPLKTIVGAVCFMYFQDIPISRERVLQYAEFHDTTLSTLKTIESIILKSAS